MTRGRLLRPPAAALLAAAIMAVAGCGAEEELDVTEGEPLHLGELAYNVQLTRFLNPEDSEDRAYLEGQPLPPRGKSYLAVFMQIENEGEEAAPVNAAKMRVVDTRDRTFKPVPAKGDFALPLNAEVPGGGEVPGPGTPAATGPIQGSMVLFLVADEITESRPVELEVPGPGGETGRVELDI